MRRSRRRLTVGVLLTGVVALLSASTSWACIFLAGLTTSPASVQPGGSLTVNGLGFGVNPIALHLDTLTGTVLATVTPGTRGSFSQVVTIPQDLGTGPHVLVATQDPVTPDGRNNGARQGVPARATFQVGTSAPLAAPAPTAHVQLAKGVGAGTLVLIAVGVACAAVLLGGLISLAVARSGRPEPSTVA